MKHSKYVKFIALTIMIAMLSALVLSCADKTTSDVSPTNAGENNITSDEQIDVENEDHNTKPPYDLPVQDFNGYNFRIISRSYAANAHWWNCDIAAEEETGDALNDAVYRRNKEVEEKYNIIITNIPADNVSGDVSKTVKAGDPAYDVVVIGLNAGQESLTTQGMLYDLKSMPHIDLTKPWWDQRAVEQLSITNKLFSTSSDLTIRDKDAIIILMFSKKLVQDNGLEDLYQLVSSGKWTFDKMHEMMKAASRDLNGDGVINDEDVVGLLTQQGHARALFNGAGEYMAKVNANGIPEITLFSERAIEICERIREIQGDKNLSLNADEYGGKYADVWDGFQVPMFAEDRALLYHAGMNRVTLLRTMETDFGIIPPPKYNEKQDKYYIWVDGWCTSAVSVPITSDPDRTGLLLEALTYESRYILLPAYYDINLKTKFARDDESKEMIDLILENRLYDIGGIYGWGNMGSLFTDLSRGRGELVTWYEKNEARIETAMQKTIDLFEAIEH